MNPEFSATTKSDRPMDGPGLSHGIGIRLPYLCILIVFIALSCLLWGHWGNVRIDCGREMYVPQQLVQGKMLYRDLWYPYGPVAPYWNALLFDLFGDRINVLYASGLIITLCFALLLYTLSRRFVSDFVAFIVVLSFLLQAFRPGLFTYILPYSYGAILGSLFALFFLYFLVRHIRGEGGPNLVLSGLMAGLTLLTKTEFGLACYLTFGFYIACVFFLNRSGRLTIREALGFLPGLLIPSVGYGWYVRRLSLGFFLNDSFTRQWYVEWSKRQGLRLVPRETLHLLLWTAMALAAWSLLAWLVKQSLFMRWKALATRTILLGLFLGALYIRWEAFFPLGRYYLLRRFLFPSGMFWLCVGALLWGIHRWRRRPSDSDLFSFIMVSFFALAIGIRIMSRVEPANYSIYYSPVLFLVMIIVLTRIAEFVARNIDQHKRALLVTVFCAIEGLGLLITNYPWRMMPTALLRTDRGNIFVEEAEALQFPRVIRFIQEQRLRGKRIVVLPEETSLYFFAGVEAPSRWYMVHPGILDPDDRQFHYIHQLESNDVQYVLLSNRTNREYGFPYFGIDYDKTVYDWILRNFVVVRQFGEFSRDNPFRFGMLVYQKHPGNWKE